MKSTLPAIFNFNEKSLHATMIDGEPWFVASDICESLEIKNSRQAVSKLDDDEKGVILNDTLGGKQSVASVNESGLYALIVQSRKPVAKAFRKWVTSEVLPSIRKTGRYEVKPDLDDGDKRSTVKDRKALYYAAIDIMIKHGLRLNVAYQAMNDFAGSDRFKSMTKSQVGDAGKFVERFLLGTDTRQDWMKIESNRKAGGDDQPPLAGFGLVPIR